MFEKYNYDDWKKQFHEETRGKWPDDLKYAPAINQNIAIPPYFDANTIPSFRFEKFSDSVDQNLLFSKSHDFPSDKLFIDYNISTCYNTTDPPIINSESHTIKWEKIEKSGDTILLKEGAKKIDIIDCSDAGQAIQALKTLIQSLNMSKEELWIIPGNDILFNIGLIRGLYKYFQRENIYQAPGIKVYLTPGAHQDIIETCLPEYATKVLSALVTGVESLIWEWPEDSSFSKNFYLFLNIAEILTREGKVKSYGDVIEGSDFFENLSSKIADQIAS